jgi:bifunctional DNA-binding transcriptional regulator/antitoxin component of YhaV-PrlF toxin-antitoxin module
MNKVLQATSRGQVTLPKKWREQFDTDYYEAKMTSEGLMLTPIVKEKNLNEELNEAWQEYKDGECVADEEVIKKYGL